MNNSQHARILAISFAAALAFYLIFPWYFLRHHDLGWHLRTGELIAKTEQIPWTDPFSFTAQGYRWMNISWLWEVLTWRLYEEGGLAWLLLSAIYAAAAILVFQVWAALRSGTHRGILALTLVWANCWVLTYEPPDNPLAVSPQALTLAMLALTNFILLCPRLTTNTKLLLCAGLQIFWANAHGGFPAGLLAIFVFVLLKRLEGTERLSPFIAFPGLAILLSPFLTPLGWSMIEAMDRSLGHKSTDFISEWKPLSLTQSPLASLYIAVFLISLLCSRPRSNQSLLVIQSLLWLAAGLIHQRYLALFFVVSVPVFASSLSRRIFPAKAGGDAPVQSASQKIPLIGALALLGLSPLLLHWRMPGEVSWPAEMNPRAEIEYLREQHRGERIFNEWNFGAFLIFWAPGELPVFIDGRAGTAYPPELFDRYERDYIAPDADWNRLLDAYQLRLALVARYRLRSVRFFATNPCWKKEFEGPTAIVFSRIDGACPGETKRE